MADILGVATTELQNEIIMAHLLHPDRMLFNLVSYAIIGEDYEIDRLARAVCDVVHTSESLSSVLDVSDGHFFWRRAEALPRPVITAYASCNELFASIKARCRRPRELLRSPLYSIEIASTPEGLALVGDFHHVLIDGIGIGLLLNRILNRYRSESSGQGGADTDLTDFLRLDEIYRRSSRREADLLYWSSQPPQSNGRALLPAIGDAASSETVSVEFRRIHLQKIDDLGSKFGANRFVTLLSLIVGFLKTRCEDLHFGISVANRSHSLLKDALISCANDVPIILPSLASMNFSDVVGFVGVAVAGAMRHARLPSGEILKSRTRSRSGMQEAGLDVCFSYMDFDGYLNKLASRSEVALQPLQMVDGNHPHMIDIFYTSHDSENLAHLAFAMTAEVEAWCDRSALAQGFLGFLETVADDPQRVLLDDALRDHERAAPPAAWNDTAIEFAYDGTIHGLFEKQANATPTAIALSYGGRDLTYGDLETQANRLAHRLVACGVGPDATVGICMVRSFEMIVGLLAVLKAGGAYLPLDPDYPADRLAFMLSDASPAAVLTHAPGAAILTAALGASDVEATVIDLTDFLGDPDPGLYRRPSLDGIGLASDRLAYVLYTSGSTGKPKGVMVEHRHVMNTLLWMQLKYEILPSDAVIQKTTIGFDDSVIEMFWTLLFGAKLVIATPGMQRDPDYILNLIVTQSISVLHFVPSGLWQLVERSRIGTCSSLRMLFCSGEEMTPALMKTVMDNVPSATLHNLYGPTEAAIDCTFWDCERSALKPDAISVPIGKPIANTKIYLLDENLSQVPVGTIGEIFVGGLGVARGYLNRDELTAEKFIPSPFGVDERLYRTGDVGRYLASGDIEFLGRSDFQVKVRGFRIELGEIEARLTEQSGVREALVLVREDQPGDKRIVAYYTTLEGELPASNALRKGLSSVLPDYMLPGAYVRLDNFPLLPNDKIDRKSLPIPDYASLASSPYEPPEGEMEELVAGIWRDVLQVEQVGRYDNFYELGGTSLLMVRVAERLERRSVRASIRVLFQANTLYELAADLDAERRDSRIPSSGPPVDVHIQLPDRVRASVEALNQRSGAESSLDYAIALTALQKGMLYEYLKNANEDRYLLSAIISADGIVELNRFIAGLQAIVDEHDILRSSFWWEGIPEPVQCVSKTAKIEVVEELPQDDDLPAIDLLLLRYRSLRMDIRKAPLIKVAFVRDGGGGALKAILLIHHLICDHVSIDVIARELSLRATGQPGLNLVAPYRDFVGEVLKEAPETDAIYERLASIVDIDARPFGLRKTITDSFFIECEHSLDSDLSADIRRVARKLHISPAAIFHVAWAIVLARTSGREHVLFGTVLAGRMLAGGKYAETIGLLINTAPACFRHGAMAITDSLLEAHDILLSLQENEQRPLSQSLKLVTGLDHDPMLVLLNYRHSASEREEAEVNARFKSVGISYRAMNGRTQYPLLLTVDDRQDGFRLFSQVTGSRSQDGVAQAALDMMSRCLDQITRSSLADDGLTADTIDVIDEAAVKDSIIAWAGPTGGGPAFLNTRFKEIADSQPLRTAVIEGDASISYGELDQRSNQLARTLRGLGVGPDKLVGLYLPRSIDLILSMLAIMKAGGAFVVLDIRGPIDRLEICIKDSGLGFLIGSADTLGTIAKSELSLPPDIHVIDVRDRASFIDVSPAGGWKPELIGLSAANLAYALYTSGTTGTPKAVLVEHQSITNTIEWMSSAYPVGPGEKILQKAANTFDVSLWEIFLPLSTGGICLLCPSGIETDLAAICELVEKEDVKKIHFSPTALRAVVDSGAVERLSAITDVFVGGEIFPLFLLSSVKEALPNARIHNRYGPTEASINVTAIECTAEVMEDAEMSVAIGSAIPGARVYLLDGRLKPVPAGSVGELYIGGRALARGYLGRPDLTAERFIPDPFVPGGRLYRTGDVARRTRADGFEVLGRSDRQIKLRGFRVEPEEIEARLSDVPGVRAAAVVTRELGAGDIELIAYVVPENDHSDINGARLRSYLGKTLPHYMIPSGYVPIDALPFLPNGKINRRALPEPDVSSFSAGEYEEVVGRTETSIRAIWEEILKIDGIGRNDNFFDLGGNSISMIAVVGMIKDGFDVDVSIQTIFENPTIKGLAAAVESGRIPLTLMNAAAE